MMICGAKYPLDGYPVVVYNPHMVTSRGNNHPIAIRRVRMGLTQTELGDIVATRQHRISEWESGARRPGLQNLGKLAKAFGVTAGTLLNEMNAWSATR